MTTRIALTILIVAGPPLVLVLLVRLTADGAHTLVLPIFGWVWVSLFIVPAALLFPLRPPREGPEPGDDGGGGGGRGPDPGLMPPGGGIPLPDALQAGARRRDHQGPLYRRTPRRAQGEPPRRIRTGPARRRRHVRGASAHD